MNHHEEYRETCRRLLVDTALTASKELGIDQKIMIHEAVAALFPPECKESKAALSIAKNLREAEKCQLELSNLLKN